MIASCCLTYNDLFLFKFCILIVVVSFFFFFLTNLFPADKLPYSIRILLESAIRNCDNFQVTKNDVEKIIDWENTSPNQVEIPFKPARVLLQVRNIAQTTLQCKNYCNVSSF